MPRRPKSAEQEAQREEDVATEFFYTNDDREDAIRHDARLHNRILREVDYPIDEEIMGPIREKNRAKWLRKRRRMGDTGVWTEELHPRERGKFTFSSREETHANAAKLFTAPTKSADEIVASVPGAANAVAHARAKLASVVETHKLVSEGGFKQEDGTYTPERAAMHEKIIDDYINADTVRKFTPPAGENPTLTVLGGRGGSGKSWLTGKDGPIDTSKSMVIDSDVIKAKLPEYQGWNAAQLHEEATDIVAMIDHRAASLGMNVVLDGTLKSDSILKRIAVYQAPEDSVYEVDGFYMYASPETAATRALKRFAGKTGDFKGRFVPPEVILGNLKNETNFDKMSENFREWSVYDNDDEGPPRLVQQSRRVQKR